MMEPKEDFDVIGPGEIAQQAPQAPNPQTPNPQSSKSANSKSER
jgi:hypothetical protein